MHRVEGMYGSSLQGFRVYGGFKGFGGLGLTHLIWRLGCYLKDG